MLAQQRSTALDIRWWQLHVLLIACIMNCQCYALPEEATSTDYSLEIAARNPAVPGHLTSNFVFDEITSSYIGVIVHVGNEQEKPKLSYYLCAIEKDDATRRGQIQELGHLGDVDVDRFDYRSLLTGVTKAAKVFCISAERLLIDMFGIGTIVIDMPNAQNDLSINAVERFVGKKNIDNIIGIKLIKNKLSYISNSSGRITISSIDLKEPGGKVNYQISRRFESQLTNSDIYKINLNVQSGKNQCTSFHHVYNAGKIYEWGLGDEAPEFRALHLPDGSVDSIHYLISSQYVVDIKPPLGLQNPEKPIQAGTYLIQASSDGRTETRKINLPMANSIDLQGSIFDVGYIDNNKNNNILLVRANEIYLIKDDLSAFLIGKIDAPNFEPKNLLDVAFNDTMDELLIVYQEGAETIGTRIFSLQKNED